MARNATIRVLRTTRAALVAQANAGNLVAGEPYLIMDEGRLAWAISTSEFRTCVTQEDLEGKTFFDQ